MELARHIKAFIRDEDGITAIEYGLLAGIIGLGIVSGATALTGGINGLYARVVTALTTAGT